MSDTRIVLQHRESQPSGCVVIAGMTALPPTAACHLAGA